MHDLNSNLKFLLSYEMRQWPKEARAWILAGLADANRENCLTACAYHSQFISKSQYKKIAINKYHTIT